MANDVVLPYRTDWREIENVLDYCKGKGADRSALETRFGAGEGLRETLNAAEQLALIERGEAGDVQLSMLGEQLAYAPDAGRRRDRLIEAIAGYRPYRAPFERALAEELALLDAPWVEHLWQVDMRLGQPRNRVEEARTFFFRLADEAGLGIYRRGVRGQTTRLELSAGAGALLSPYLERPPERPAAPVDSRLDVPSAASGREPAPDRARAEHLSIPGAVIPGVVVTINVDMTDWDFERIERFLGLVGYRHQTD